MDAAGKYKEMEQKCVEMERRRMEAEEKLMEEMEKNSYYKITNDELKLGLKNIEDLQKENSELKLKVEEAVKSEMDMFMIDSAPIVDTNKVDVEKDIEILALKNELEDKKQLVEKEARLMKEVDYLKSIEKELCEKEDSYQRELEILRMENLRISHQLTSLKEKNKAEDFGTEDSGSDDELFSKYESELVELKLKNSALLKENSEINKLLTEKDNELHELLENEDEMNKIIAQDKTLKGSTKEEGDFKVASELQRTKEQNLSELEKESEVSFELLPEQQEILTQTMREEKGHS